MKNIIVSVLFMLPIMSFSQDTFNVFCLNSNLQLIEESNNGIYNKTISDSAIKLIVGAMEFEDSKEDLDGNEVLSKRRSYIKMFNTLDTSIISDEISKTVLDKKKKTGEITATLGKYLCEMDSTKNWIFFILNGFLRTDENYRKANAKGAMSQILSLGMYANYPIRSVFELSIYKINPKTNQIEFYDIKKVSDKRFTQETFFKLLNKFSSIYKSK
jgi:hypothetical protein